MGCLEILKKWTENVLRRMEWHEFAWAKNNDDLNLRLQDILDTVSKESQRHVDELSMGQLPPQLVLYSNLEESAS